MELRWLGAGLVMAGSVCAGFWYRMRYLERLANLRECQRALSVLQGEIRYGRTPLPEACYEVGKRVGGACCLFFRRVAEQLQEGACSVGQVWKEATEEIFSSSQMKPEDREEWKRIGNTLGYLDVELQLRTMDLYYQRLQSSIAQADAERSNRTRMYPLLGTFGGVLICLVLI